MFIAALVGCWLLYGTTLYDIACTLFFRANSVKMFTAQDGAARPVALLIWRQWQWRLEYVENRVSGRIRCRVWSVQMARRGVHGVSWAYNNSILFYFVLLSCFFCLVDGDSVAASCCGFGVG